MKVRVVEESPPQVKSVLNVDMMICPALGGICLWVILNESLNVKGKSHFVIRIEIVSASIERGFTYYPRA